MGLVTDVYLNKRKQETLANGVDLGDDGAAKQGPHVPNKLANTDHLRTELNANILKYCEHQCPGCYINRNPAYVDDDLTNILNTLQTLQNSGYDCEELFIGPTDIFSAKNFYEILDHPDFIKLIQTFSLTFSTTLMSDRDEVEARMRALNHMLRRAPARDVVFVVVLDLEKFTSNDVEYLHHFEYNLKLLEEDTVYFIANFTDPKMFQQHKTTYAMQQMRVRLLYNVELRIAPSFFRLKNADKVERYSQMYSKFMTTHIDALHDVTTPMFNKHFGGAGFVNFAYINQKLYAMPFLFEGIPIEHELFEIKGTTEREIAVEYATIQSKQYGFVGEMDECGNCELLASCINRNVLNYMKSRNVTKCILPKSLIQEGSGASN